MKSSLSSPRKTSRKSAPNPALESVPVSVPLAVPLLDLRRQYDGIREDVLVAIARVCDSQSFILGPEVEALEREIAALTGAACAVGCASGTEALWLALVAAGVKPGDSVITTAFSFFASASAIVRAGATPVFVDVDPGTLNLDAALVGQQLRDRQLRRERPENVRAILPVHLYGQCADMDAFDRVVKEYGKENTEEYSQKSGVAIIEDAAQAIGAKWSGHAAGSLGVAAAFSFYPTKNLSAYGDAGLVTTNSPEMAAHMRRLRNHGSSRRYVHEEFGWNSRLDAIQAAILRVKLKYVEGWNEARRQCAARYDQLFAVAGLTSSAEQSAAGRGENAAPIQLPPTAAQAHHVFHQYVVRAYRRDELREFLTARKIGTEIYYPLPLHLQPCFLYLGYREGDFPEAERAAKEVLALPMFPELSEDEQRWVVTSIADFYC